MNRLVSRIGFGVVAAGLAFAGVANASEPAKKDAPKTEAPKTEAPKAPAKEAPKAGGTVVDWLAADSNFSTLVGLVKEAGLAETLSGKGPFTIFAPTNAAFAKVDAKTLADLKADPKGKLADLLKGHVVNGSVMAADVSKMKEATFLNGKKAAIEAKDGKVTVGGVAVSKADNKGSNGVVHVVDGVIMAK